jgi:hypothetical protein
MTLTIGPVDELPHATNWQVPDLTPEAWAKQCKRCVKHPEMEVS